MHWFEILALGIGIICYVVVIFLYVRETNRVNKEIEELEKENKELKKKLNIS